MSKYSLGEDFRKIVQHLPELEIALGQGKTIDSYSSEDLELNKLVTSYLKHYNLPCYSEKNIELIMGKFKSSKFDVVVQIYKKQQQAYKGVIVFVHGYLDHFGLYKNLISLLVNDGYIFIGIDLPGHGLSTGKIAHIGDFGQYAHSIELLVDIMDSNFKLMHVPYFIMGYSAGAAISIEYLLRNSAHCKFSKAIWLAPLLRIPRWKYTEIACNFLPFIKYVPRESKNTSHDSRFITFIRFNDPLQPKLVPLQWVSAMHHWVARLPKYQPLNIPTCIIQGTEDKTIDWKYNIPNLAKIFRHHQVHYIYNGYHNLCNEEQEYRQLTFEYLLNFIN